MKKEKKASKQTKNSFENHFAATENKMDSQLGMCMCTTIRTDETCVWLWQLFVLFVDDAELELLQFDVCIFY